MSIRERICADAPPLPQQGFANIMAESIIDILEVIRSMNNMASNVL